VFDCSEWDVGSGGSSEVGRLTGFLIVRDSDNSIDGIDYVNYVFVQRNNFKTVWYGIDSLHLKFRRDEESGETLAVEGWYS